MLVGTRFGIGVRDPIWFKHRLRLISSITAPSLLAQTDQAFQWVLFVDSALPGNVRAELEEILTPFEGRATLHTGPHLDVGNIWALANARNVIDSDGFLLTGTIDDDDAWHVSTVAAVKEQVAAWQSKKADAPGLGLTFNNGLEWVMYDMLDIEQLQDQGRYVTKKEGLRPFTLTFLSMSVFVYAQPTDNISAISMGHSQSAKELESRNFTQEIISTDEPMWLYCRHKQTDSETGTQFEPNVPLVKKDIGFLVREFGLSENLIVKYRADAEQHGYCVRKSASHHRMRLVGNLLEVQKQLQSSGISDARMLHLQQQERRINEALARIAADLVGSPKAPRQDD